MAAKKKFKLHRYVLYYLLIVLRQVFQLFPYETGVRFGGWAGRMAFHLLAKERHKTLGHLRFAFGAEKTEDEIFRLAEKVFTNYGMTVAEMALIDKLIPRFEQYVTMTGKEHLDRGLAAGKGIIITTAHLGNWEIMGGFNALRGYPLTVIARKIYFEKYDRLLVATRKKMNVEVIYRDGPVKTMFKVLRQNRILGMVVDQDVDTIDGIFVDFFGHPAYTSIAPVRFAMVSGAVIVPAFCVRQGLKHRIIVEPAIEWTQGADDAETIRINTQRWVSVQETFIRKYPECWVWNHKRWKTRPSPAHDQK